MSRKIQYIIRLKDGSTEQVITEEHNNVVLSGGPVFKTSGRFCAVTSHAPQSPDDYARLLGEKDASEMDDKRLGGIVRVASEKEWKVSDPIRSGMLPLGAHMQYVVNPDIPRGNYTQRFDRDGVIVSASYLNDGHSIASTEAKGPLEHSLLEMLVPTDAKVTGEYGVARNSLIKVEVPKLETEPQTPLQRYKKGGTIRIPDIEGLL